MGEATIKLCSGFLLWFMFTHTNCFGNEGLQALRELKQQTNINRKSLEPMCNCSGMLIPKVKDVHGVMWVIAGIFENALGKAALNVRRRSNKTPADEENSATGRSGNPSGSRFLDKMERELLPSIEQVHRRINRLGLSSIENPADVSAIQRRFINEGDTEDCPYFSTVHLYNTLSDQVTDAAHLMANVENDPHLTEATLSKIFMMATKMDTRTNNYSRLLEDLESLPCPEPEEVERQNVVRSFGEKELDCFCVTKLLPQAISLTDQLDWILQVLKETQAYAILTIKGSPVGRSAPGDSSFNQTFLGVNFYKSFNKEPGTPSLLLQRSSLQEFEGGCPLTKLREYGKKLEGKMTDAVHYREDVKKDALIARHILTMVNESIDELTSKLGEYQDFIQALESRNCLLPVVV